jgi:exodeoxyribonuclease-5
MSHTTLTPHQQEIYENIENDIIQSLSNSSRSDDKENQIISLIGAAGVGKSFMTAQIIKSLSEKFKRYNIGEAGIIVTAPTHKAVKVLKSMLATQSIDAQCCTIHSFLNIQPQYNYHSGEEKFTVIRTKKAPPRASLLIVDESSMVSTSLYNFIVEAISRGQVNTVLFIGDSNQLLPVNNGKNKIFTLKQYELTEIVRQAKESNIIKLATKIRERIATQNFISLKDIFSCSETDDIEFFDDKEEFVKDYCKNDNWFKEDKVITAYTNKEVEAYNKIIRDSYWQEQGIKNPSFILSKEQMRFKSPLVTHQTKQHPTVVFQNSDEVVIDKVELVQNENTNFKYWKCTVVGRSEKDFFKVIDPDSQTVFNEYLEALIHSAKTASFAQRAQHWFNYYRTKNSFADVQYIFANTIHKTQGSTYDTVYIDLGGLIHNKQIPNDLKYRLAYVAITRARKNVKILF